MEPELQLLGVRLAEAAVRNTATSVADRIALVTSKKRDRETVAELEQIINDLQADKNELVRIARAFEDELVAQRISASDLEYITGHIVPVITQLMESAATDDAGNAQEILDLVEPILSVETVTVLQLLGFNFRKAIGEPLTELVSRLILAKADASPEAAIELQRLSVARDLAYLEIAKDADAHARLARMNGQS